MIIGSLFHHKARLRDGEETPFPDLLRRVRAGDQDAAVELVRRYESAIRRAVRIKLLDSRLTEALESMDICQSVMGSFFYRAALGQYEMEKPEDLVRLLVTMARNKLTDQVRRQTTERRGRGFNAQNGPRRNRSPAPSRRPAASPPRASSCKRPGAASAPTSAGSPNNAPGAALGRPPPKPAPPPKPSARNMREPSTACPKSSA